MNIMNSLILLLMLSTATVASSKKDEVHTNTEFKIPIDVEKPIQMWIDAHANLSRFSQKSSITSYLRMMKETGFNEVYVDVKPGIGYALYNSDILPALTKWGDETIERDWDYLSYWIEFRTMTITNFITNIRSKVRSVNSDLELHLWASADWRSRYSVGQNWASKKYKPAGSHGIYTETYSKTGFADQIDVFSLGAYADHVWIAENPNSVWSVENFVTTYSDFTMDDCDVYGSIASYAYGNNTADISDAVYLCLKKTDGLMVFEISHVINNNQWSAIKDGISRVYK